MLAARVGTLAPQWFFLDAPFHEDGATWVLPNQWGGALTESAFENLCLLDPTAAAGGSAGVGAGDLNIVDQVAKDDGSSGRVGTRR